jgi:hypothetical protein
MDGRLTVYLPPTYLSSCASGGRLLMDGRLLPERVLNILGAWGR